MTIPSILSENSKEDLPPMPKGFGVPYLVSCAYLCGGPGILVRKKVPMSMVVFSNKRIISSLLVVSLNLSSYNHDNVLGSPRKPSMLMSFDLYDLHDIVGYQ